MNFTSLPFLGNTFGYYFLINCKTAKPTIKSPGIEFFTYSRAFSLPQPSQAELQPLCGAECWAFPRRGHSAQKTDSNSLSSSCIYKKQEKRWGCSLLCAVRFLGYEQYGRVLSSFLAWFGGGKTLVRAKMLRGGKPSRSLSRATKGHCPELASTEASGEHRAQLDVQFLFVCWLESQGFLRSWSILASWVLRLLKPAWTSEWVHRLEVPSTVVCQDQNAFPSLIHSTWSTKHADWAPTSVFLICFFIFQFIIC